MEYEPHTAYPRKDLYGGRSRRRDEVEEGEDPVFGLGRYFKPVYLAPIAYGREGEAEPKEEVHAGSLADRVFGHHLRRGSVTSESLHTQLDKRAELSKHILHDLYDQRNDFSNRLSIARRPYSIRHPQEVSRLDKMLFDVESEIRSEELNFWKDAAEVQAQFLEAYFEFAAVKQRASLFDGAGEAYG